MWKLYWLQFRGKVMENGIKKIIKEKDENGNEIEVEVTEYPDIPVIVVNSEESEDDNSK